MRTAVGTAEEPPSLRRFRPRDLGDVTEIAVAFKADEAAVVRVPRDDVDARHRIVHFLSGLAFGRDGTLERIERDVFLLVPAGRPRPRLR